MVFFDLALFSAMGTMAGESLRYEQAAQLNQMGIEYAENEMYEESLQCFLEAEALLPDEPVIKKNKHLCIDALNGI